MRTAGARAVRDSGAHSRQELLADLGLGRRLPAVVARRLLRTTEREEAKSGTAAKPASVVIRGTGGHGRAARRLLPADPATTSSAP